MYSVITKTGPCNIQKFFSAVKIKTFIEKNCICLQTQFYMYYIKVGLKGGIYFTDMFSCQQTHENILEYVNFHKTHKTKLDKNLKM